MNMSSFVPSKSRLLLVFHQKKKAAEVHRLPVETYGEHVPVIKSCETKIRQFLKWILRLNRQRITWCSIKFKDEE